jgi:hypothetical protein
MRYTFSPLRRKPISKNIKTVPTKDFEEVVATVAKYVEGLRVGSVADLAQAFHKDAVMYGFMNGQLLGGPIKNLYDFVEKNGTAPDIKTRVDVLAITQRRQLCASILRGTRSAATTLTSTRSSSLMAPGTSSPRFITCTKGKGHVAASNY